MSVTDKELDDLEKQIEAKAGEAPKPEKPEPSAPPAPEPPPAAAQAPQESEETPFDPADWVKKKGWTKPEDAAKSMRELENAFHKSQEENARLKREQQPPFQPGWPQQPPQAPWQGYPPYQAAPMPQYAPPANHYAPGWTQPAPRANEEQIAASYGMTTEDFRRVLAVAKDISAVQAQQLSQEINAWRERTERENEKSSDLQNVMTDPAFHRPEVQFEMHELFEKQKELWNERRPYSTVLDKALTNIARKQLGGATRPSGSTLPTEPPKSGGHAGGGLPGKRGLAGLPSVEQMQDMKPEEIEKHLKSAGAMRTWRDLA